MSEAIVVVRPIRGGRAQRIVDALASAVSVGSALLLHAEVAAALRPAPLRDVAFVLAAVHGLAVLWRTRHPVAVASALVATATGYVLIGLPAYMLGPAALFAVYGAATSLDTGGSLRVLVGIEAALAVLLTVGPAFPGIASLVLYLAVVAAAWWLGHLVRSGRTAAEEHRRRAEELAATRDELARFAVAAERLRIARELHDVVAHSMTVVAMHAGTGRMVADRDPDSARAALETIEGLTREAIGEMRRMVGLLRLEPGADEQLQPAPGLADLPRLVGEMVATGLTVEVRTDGPLERVPAGPALAAYRIVQEALTNTARHAGPCRVEVGVSIAGAELIVTVHDEGSPASNGASAREGGAGLVGMRERAELYRGSLRSGPDGNGGWTVEARLPVAGDLA